MRKITITLFIISQFFATGVGDALVRTEDVKAAFIFHFITFTEWEDHRPSYYVCIPDDELLKEVARESLEDKTVNNRDIVVMDKVFDGCHVTVADISPDSDTMLTIGRLQSGAMFEFRTVQNKLKFAANPDRIKRSKLKISSQLLKLAILENTQL